MIININANGDILEQEYTEIVQGDNNANKIYLVAPIASNAQVRISFQLPNGFNTEPYLMKSTMPLSNNLNIWEKDIVDVPITEYYGLIKFQIKATINGATIAVVRGKFKVKEGVDWQLPAQPTSTVYTDILNALARIEADVLNKVDVEYVNAGETITQQVINNSNGLKFVKTVDDETTTVEIKNDGLYVDDVRIADSNEMNNLFEQVNNSLAQMAGKKYPVGSTTGTGEIFNDYYYNVASGNYSHAENLRNTASGHHSHAGGSNSVVSNNEAFAHGLGLKTSRNRQAVFGQYNADDPDALLIVGNGNYSQNIEKNIFVVKANGDIYGGDNKKLATEEYVGNYALEGKQDKITSTNKLDADLVDDTNSTNKFTNSTEKQTWNDKQDALPTSSTAGKVLKSTDTSGSTEWGDLSASDVGALPSSTKYGASLDVSGTSVQLKDQDGNNLGSAISVQDSSKADKTDAIGSIELTLNSTTYVMTLQAKNINGQDVGTAQTIDLPLESIVSSATYYNSYTYDGTTYTKVIVLVLSTTSVPTIVPVGELVSGLQNEITSQNKLSADLIADGTTNKVYTATEQTKLSGIESGAQVNKLTGVKGNAENSYRIGNVNLDPDNFDDTNATNKFVTSSEKSTWNGKQDLIDSTHKLSSDLVDDTNATNKFVTANEKNTWNGKQNALTAGDGITIDANNKISAKGIFYATYGVTTYDEIDTALGNGLLPICVTPANTSDQGTVKVYIYSQNNRPQANAKYYFSRVENNQIFEVYVNESDNWYNTTTTLQENLPTTSTAGQVLKSTSTAGTTAWGTLSASDVGALPSNTTYVSSVNGDSGAITNVEKTTNKVTSLSSLSTDTEYPSAKCVYDLIGDVETLLASI